MPTPTFHLEGVIKSREEMQDFEGPLNLILTLLSKNRIEIRDIQISIILEQYLEYIAEMQEMDLEIASEFVLMASHLVYIKTRTLLSADEEISELDLLITSLEQLKCKDIFTRIKTVTDKLGRAYERGALLGVKPPEPQVPDREYRYSHEINDLLSSLLSVYTRGGSLPGDERVPSVVPERITYGVREKSLQIIDWLSREGDLPISALFGKSRSRSELVATFISVLELCGMGSLRLYTGGVGEIIVGFTQDADTESIIEAISGEESRINED